MLERKINSRDYYHKLKTKSLITLVDYKKGLVSLKDLKFLLDTLRFIDSSEVSYRQTKLLLADILTEEDYKKVFG